MVENVSGGKSLPSEVVQQIVSKTDGVPLFVEELTKTVLESVESKGSIESGGRLDRSALSLGIPTTLQDALMARLDRLGAAKEIAQLGATLGREFSYELLHAVSPVDEDDITAGAEAVSRGRASVSAGTAAAGALSLQTCTDSGYGLSVLAQEQTPTVSPPDSTNVGGTVSADRRDPTRIGRASLHRGRPGRHRPFPIGSKPGSEPASARPMWKRLAHLTKGLELLKTLPDTPEHAQQELTLQIALGTPLMVTKGYAAPEVEQAYTRARELCRQVGETPQLFPVLWGLCPFYYDARQSYRQRVSWENSPHT